MSLVCCECGVDVQPGDELPGREGGMIYANVVAMIWTGKGTDWVPAYVQPSYGIACCFSCLTKGVLLNRFELLSALYDAYNADVALRRHERSLHGAEFGMEAHRELNRRRDELIEQMKIVPRETCLCCGKGKDEEVKTFFTFVVMDRAHCEKNPSVFGSYQFSDIKTGTVATTICFRCAEQYLPRIVTQFSHGFRGTGEVVFPGAGTVEIVGPEDLMRYFSFETKGNA